MANDDFGRFGRRSVGGGDDFESMRAQMAKERDAFFRDSGDWGMEPPSQSRAGYFTTPRSSFSGFPSGGVPLFDPLVGRLPTDTRAQRSNEEDSVPISVVHERGGPLNKHKYSGAGVRNTTELPGAARANGEQGSPRLERAHSEPPKQFNARLNLARPSHYSTIPENTPETQPAAHPAQPSAHPNNNPIKTSASAPSVPDTGVGPVPPPRRSPPRPAAMNNAGVPTAAAANVRHIPIFVEGRPEPIFNTNVEPQQSAGTQGAGAPAAQDNISFPKPSDYYPKGVQRIRSRDESELEPLKIPANNNPQEPTTPQGPPPGPIPMGYVPPPAEPTTPMGPPPGPIPMGYMPNSPLEPPAEPIPLPCDPELVKQPGGVAEPARESTPPQTNIHPEHNNQQNPLKQPDLHQQQQQQQQQQEQHQKQLQQQQQQQEQQQQHEPVVNFIPIKVAHGRPTSPLNRPASRPSSQELRGGAPSPRPSPTPPTEDAKPEAPKDPRLGVLEAIDMEAEILGPQVDGFTGSKKDKMYLWLDDRLTKLLIKADGIDIDGATAIRQQRKESCSRVNKLADLLEQKASSTN